MPTVIALKERSLRAYTSVVQFMYERLPESEKATDEDLYDGITAEDDSNVIKADGFVDAEDERAYQDFRKDLKGDWEL